MRKKRNRGQVLVLFAISLVVLIGLAALGIDVGYMYSVRHDLQRCADAGALAGASRFINAPGETGQWGDSNVFTEATARAIDYATRDNVVQLPLAPGTIPGDNVIVTFPAEDRIGVETRRTVPLFFSKLFLGATKQITAYAVAEAAWSSANVKCPAPFGVPVPWIENFYGPGGDPYKFDPGIDCVVSLGSYPDVPETDSSHPCNQFQNQDPTQWSYQTHDNVVARSGRDGYLCKGTLLNLKIGEPGKTQEPGHFYALDLSDLVSNCPPGVTPNPGASFYKYMIKNRNCESGCQTNINLGQPLPPIDIKPGDMVGPTVQAVAPTYYKDIGFIGQIPDPDSLMNGAPSGPYGPPGYDYLNYTATNYTRGWADWVWNRVTGENGPRPDITPYRLLEVPMYDPSNPPAPGKSMIQPVAFVGIWIQDISENQGTIVAKVVELKSSGMATDPGGGSRRTQVIRLVE